MAFSSGASYTLKSRGLPSQKRRQRFVRAGGQSSQVADAAGRSMKVARYTASSLEERGAQYHQSPPYTVVAIALGLGWLLGRMHRPL